MIRLIKRKKKETSSQHNNSTISTSKKSLAPIEILPVLTKSGYKTSPEYKVLCRMTLEEIQKVKNFQIFNEYGKVEYLEPVDLSNLNLDKIFSIEDRAILVYQSYKPEEGKELNKPANVHLYKCFPKDEELPSEEINLFVDTLKGLCKEKEAEFVDYNPKTGEWIFKVENFN